MKPADLLRAAALATGLLASVAPTLARTDTPAAAPRAVTPRGPLAADEQAHIELFRRVSPSDEAAFGPALGALGCVELTRLGLARKSRLTALLAVAMEREIDALPHRSDPARLALSQDRRVGGASKTGQGRTARTCRCSAGHPLGDLSALERRSRYP